MAKASTINLFNEIATINEEIKALEVRKADINAKLQTMIPPGAAIDGVRHVVITRPTVSYAKVYEAIYRTLLTPAKRIMAETIMLAHTKTTEIHQIRVAKED